jgi:carboxyl-terminal processing protease
MTSRTRLSVLLISTPVLAFVLVGGLMGKTTNGNQQFQHLRVFDDVVSLVLNNYVEEVKVDRVMEGAMRGLADGLDADSAYLTPRQVRSIEAGDTQPEGDVGLELTRQYYLRAIAARDGSPAAKAGLQTGDYVRAIDGKPTRDMSVFEGTQLLRGQPGSKVVLTVIRGNAADPHEVTLVREKVTGAQVSGRLVGDAGYVRIAAFRPGVADDLRRQIAELTKSGAKSLVLDVRRTAEGPLEIGIAAARLFVKSGTLAIKAGRETSGQQKETVAARAGDGSIDLPAILLVTTGTSGAAELFAAALDGNKRAELVGERTLGRAGLQKLVKLPEYRGLWLTYARYLTPDGEPIHGRGLEPDVQVEEPDVEFGAAAPEQDVILDAALERLRTRPAA